MILLSSTQAAEMLKQFRRGNRARASLDLGRSETEVSLSEGQVLLTGEVSISLDNLRRIADSERGARKAVAVRCHLSSRSQGCEERA